MLFIYALFAFSVYGIATIKVNEGTTSGADLFSALAPPMTNVKSHFWRSDPTKGMPHNDVIIKNQDCPNAHVDMAKLLPGEYYFILSRFDGFKVEHTEYRVVLMASVKESAARSRREELERLNLTMREMFGGKFMDKAEGVVLRFLNGFRLIGEFCQGLTIYLQQLSDRSVTCEVFLSDSYKERWYYYGVDISVYDEIRTCRELEEYRAYANREPGVFVNLYFAANRNSSYPFVRLYVKIVTALQKTITLVLLDIMEFLL